MSWLGRLRFWTTGGHVARNEVHPALSLNERINWSESELRDITRDVYAVLLNDERGRTHAERS